MTLPKRRVPFLINDDGSLVQKSWYDLLGDLSTGVAGAVEIAQDAVGVMVDSTLVYVDATPLLTRAALTGDVTAPQASNVTTIANDAVTTAKILNDAVTFAKVQNITDARLLGRSAGSSGDMMEITVGVGLSLAAGALVGTGGDVVGPASATDNAIARFDLTTGKLLQNSTAFVDDSGRVLTGSGTAQLVGITSAIEALGTTDNTSGITLARWSADISPPNLIFGKARGAAIGTNTIVASGDYLGGASFWGANGTTFTNGAAWNVIVDGTPGASADMPTRQEWLVAADASGTPTIRMVLKATGTLLVGTTVETASAGRVQLGTTSDTTAASGLNLGTDVQIHRQAANVLQVPDNIMVTGARVLPTFTTTQIRQSSTEQLFVDGSRTINNRAAAVEFVGGIFEAFFANDAYSAAAYIMRATGGQAAGISLISFPDATATVFGLTAANANGGKLQTKAGNQTTNNANVGGTLYYNVTQVGNGALTETDAFSHSVAAATLATDGDSLEFESAGTFAATASVDKRIKVVFGSTTIFDTGALAITGATDWGLKGTIIRTGAATQKSIVTLSTSSASLSAYADYSAPTETLANALTLKLTLNATLANDVLAEFYKEKWAAAA